jgi:hypothetical protein
MANLTITAKASMFKYSGPIALTPFKDEDKNPVVAMPETFVAKGKKMVKWTIPDTSENRSLFRKYYAKQYACKAIDVEQPEDFDVRDDDSPAAGTLHLHPKQVF